MKFYKELSRVYDIVFPLDSDTLNFLSKDLTPEAKVLDMACGTGSYAIELAAQGHKVTGIDLGCEMISIAESKKGSFDVKFHCMDMREAEVSFKDKSYDLIYCIGNSIVHLHDKHEVNNLLGDMYNMLSPNGEAVVQIVNYDRVINKNITSLPTIVRSDKGVTFVRNYRHSKDENIIHFDTELIIKNEVNSAVYNNSVPLIPLKSYEIVSMIRGIGFKKLEIFGDFDSTEYNEGAFALVVRAYK